MEYVSKLKFFNWTIALITIKNSHIEKTIFLNQQKRFLGASKFCYCPNKICVINMPITYFFTQEDFLR